LSGTIGDPANWLQFAEKHWHRPAGLVAAAAFLILLLTGVFALVKPSSIICAIAYVLSAVLVVTGWRWSNRLPRTKKGKVGFVVSIYADEEAERVKIKEDFIRTLHELLKEGPSGQSFQVITLPNHVAEDVVDQDDAQQLRVTCRARFVIYGRVRLRTIDGSQQHVLHLEGLVAHKPVAQPIAESLPREFAELLPRRVRIATENDVFSFAFTSEWLNCVARYIIGIAAACSGDLDYAEQLQTEVHGLLSGKDQAFSVFATLKQRVPVRLAEIRHARARKAYNKWRRSRDPADMDTMARHLDSVPSSGPNQYGVLLFKSICLFVRNRDVKGAMDVLKKCRGQTEATWLYNLAFLHAYAGDLKGAIRRYRNAMKLRVGDRTVVEVEEFMCWLLEEEPEKYQLYYCLGFLNWKAKGDT